MIRVALVLVALTLLCAPSRNTCEGLVNARVTYNRAPGYTAGDVVWEMPRLFTKPSVYFHPGRADGSAPPYNGEPHFHLLVPCERLRVAP